ncbi:CRISPR-associated helicase Cas3' [Umezawaea sp. Da 62-37]|uniref:CRISPR-associated helicase Cas3' n=1 Tax=Umezawaea sp. Da 62-37 TaxID=3075927 RepID=UPI0037DCF5B5
MADHARSTAVLAGWFARPFGAEALAAALGLLHDAGKCDCLWQAKLVKVSGTDQPVGINHKDLGAMLLREPALAAAMAILGHHGGLGSVADLMALQQGPDDAVTAQRFFDVVPEAREVVTGPILLPASWTEDPLVGEMGIRLVFSALVDADHLDTAAHFADRPPPRPAAGMDMAVLWERFERNRIAFLAARARKNLRPSPVDGVRAALYEQTVRRAMGKPGVYRLPAPTGSGKTITAAGFALRHAAEHGMSRVIVAVPFTTITEQNAEVYRTLLGEEVVLEHHSNAELDDRRFRTAAENWDSPFVVTTTVQLFDSLFGNRPARSRKLHRLANAVIVLDEVQSLPVALLVPILDALRLLTRHFGTTVLLASATQPAFEYLAVWRDLEIQELVEDPIALFAGLRRVRYQWRLDPRPTPAELAEEIAGHLQALVVVNTVAHARILHRLLAAHCLDAVVLHLSTRMCPLHRRQVLAEVQRLLGAGEPVLVVSTQLVEAGVDVDFPVVFRALAPAESLQQAAGRANREGTQSELGLVVVFDAADAPVPAFYRAAVDKTRARFGPGLADPDDPVALAGYYASLYTGLNVDEATRGATIQANRAKLDFRAVAEGPVIDTGVSGGRDSRLAFRMIDEDPVPVVVTTFGDTGRVAELLDLVRAQEGPAREVVRELRGHTVALPRRVAQSSWVRALCRPVIAGNEQWWEWVGQYDPQVGIDEGSIGEETVW